MDSSDPKILINLLRRLHSFTQSLYPFLLLRAQRYHSIIDALWIVRNAHFGLIAEKMRLGHPLHFSMAAIEAVCQTVTDVALFNMIYTQHRSLFYGPTLVTAAAGSGNLAILEILVAQTKPIPLPWQNALATAIYNGHDVCARFLIARVLPSPLPSLPLLLSHSLTRTKPLPNVEMIRYLHDMLAASHAPSDPPLDPQLFADLLFVGHLPLITHIQTHPSQLITYSNSAFTWYLNRLNCVVFESPNTSVISHKHIDIILQIGSPHFPRLSDANTNDIFTLADELAGDSNSRNLFVFLELLDVMGLVINMDLSSYLRTLFTRFPSTKSTAYLCNFAVKHRLPYSLFDDICKVGTIEQVKYAHSLGMSATNYAMDSAHTLEITQYLHENVHVGCTSRAVDVAAERGSLDSVKWLLDNRNEGYGEAIQLSAKHGHEDVFLYLLHRKGIIILDRNTMYDCHVRMLILDHYEAIENLLQINAKESLDDFIGEACYRDYRLAIDSLITRRIAANQEPVSPRMLEMAVAGGHLSLVDHLMAAHPNVQLGDRVWSFLGQYGDVDSFHRLSVYDSGNDYLKTLKTAVEYGRLSLVTFIVKGYEVKLSIECVVRAIRRHHIHVVSYLLDTMGPLSTDDTRHIIHQSLQQGNVAMLENILQKCTDSGALDGVNSSIIDKQLLGGLFEFGQLPMLKAQM
eukprot:gene6259-7260_t